MYKLYCITNLVSDGKYIGMTKNSLSYRWNGHTYAVRSGKKSKLYDAMRSYGIENFLMYLIGTYETKEDCCNAEIALISKLTKEGYTLYNLASGGEGGFNITNVDEWKKKLRIARQGGKPFQGKSHTEETKRKCGEAAKRYHQSRAKSNELG